MTMMACKRSPIPRLADGYSREAAAKCVDFVGAATSARPAHIGSYSLDHGAGKVRKLAEIVAATALCGELSLGSAIVAGEWVGAHEPLGRNRPASRGFNSEKEASWTG